MLLVSSALLYLLSVHKGVVAESKESGGFVVIDP
jgi:hypothetical protein